MALKTRQALSVGDTAIRLDQGTGQAAQVIVTNKHVSADLTIGPLGLTAGNGYRLAASESISFDFNPTKDPVYGIVASGSVTVDVFTID